MDGVFANRCIVLGITGSIAAYKACDVASRLAEAGADVVPVLSHGAREFVGAASLEGITGQRAITGMFEPAHSPEIEHIALARRADLFLIAPATANILAKAAHGLADDWLTTTLLATRAPVLFAPAMNTMMYQHPATQENIRILKARGCRFVGPGDGALACGEVGPGRLIDTPAILDAAAITLRNDRSLRGRHVLITSGANHEPIDPVRYIGNRSSGKMGHALALEALMRGAEVTVVCGPCDTPPPNGARVISAPTARAMLEAVDACLPEADIFIAAAAVADYRVENPPTEKQKRAEGGLTLSLAPNPDIAAHVGVARQPHQIAVGFAAETHDILAHAAEKLRKKHLDLIVANDVRAEDSGFGSDTTRAWFLTPDAEAEALPLTTKAELARRLFDRLLEMRPALTAAIR
ncbi:MAG: bifunctional phosphopantothenoylcysteine decarboxylase/phosphopantothenate--cysteine ligase CoaBC [Candidatus Hydrogenedentes bacterium]|nr:bifunctional phosphopantothenoylcysteine decarboxylase/phosphopantothenate--cysteine ligase CoaBC [Candidatus Hydrogenedentota bacterium]